ncbi:MAG: hypothetical protein V5A27_00105 [Halapricum sp.]
MNFFKRVGRQVEEFKQTATEAAEEDAVYQCQACDERFNAKRDQCPECETQTIALTAEQE